MGTIQHFYVYRVIADKAAVVYEWTVDTEQTAKARVRALAARGAQAFYTVDKPVAGYFY